MANSCSVISNMHLMLAARPVAAKGRRRRLTFEAARGFWKDLWGSDGLLEQSRLPADGEGSWALVLGGVGHDFDELADGVGGVVEEDFFVGGEV